ncbi:hypothetical protein COCVIDRAFT_42475 [Bipolaris victoriae FI3]|uniref:Cytochrome P450 n=1 Tax=Bipolaris victoriae (strain FI3) TaxID=930091 RepID=W7E6I0_BIPV3|nr:hypothetical protein COCVIDRAFT_42475 [Bipolaris victoriae FI3]
MNYLLTTEQVVVNFFCTCVYNICFHPLRKYPGPKLAAATGLVFFYKMLRGDEVAFEHAMHQKYGEVVRLGPDRLTYIAPEAWKDIAGAGAGKRLENTKDATTLGPNIHGDSTMGAMYDTAIHRARRRIYAPAFSDRGALKQQEPLFLGYLNSLKRLMKEKATNEPDTGMDISRYLNFLTFDVMADLTFGEPLGLLEKSEYTPWVASMFGHLLVISIGRVKREYKLFDKLLSIVMPKGAKEKAYEHYNHSADRVGKRLARGIDIGKPDIWKLVMERNENGSINLSKREMTADAASFMFAGTETSATTLSGLLYLLLKNPEKNATTPDRKALRIYPAAPLALFRVTPKGGNMICGELIPERTRVAVPHYAAYHSALNFKDPDSFIPERWLPGTEYESDRKGAFQPFSCGSRNCIGQNLANHETRTTVAHLIWHFDFELCPESANWIDQKVHMVWVKPPLMVKLKYVR